MDAKCLDPARRQLIEETIAAQGQLMRHIHSAIFQDWLTLDLTMGQLKGLVCVATREHTTVGEVADTLGIGKSAASLMVDRLVQLGLVAREDDPEDRRRAVLRLRPEGDRLVERLREDGRGRVAGWLARLDADDLAAFLRGLRALIAAAQAERDEGGARDDHAASA